MFNLLIVALIGVLGAGAGLLGFGHDTLIHNEPMQQIETPTQQHNETSASAATIEPPAADEAAQEDEQGAEVGRVKMIDVSPAARGSGFESEDGDAYTVLAN